MFFTLVFGGTAHSEAAKRLGMTHEESNVFPNPRPTYHLVFHPWPLWRVYDSLQVWGPSDLLHRATFNPGFDIDDDWSQHEVTGYRIGYLQPLLQREGLSSESNPNVAVCVQSAGLHGTKEDLQRLISDLQNHKFEITIVRMDE